MQNYFGDAFIGCRPECLQNSDCTFNMACINMKCTNPCSNACGANAECACVNHNPMCYCNSDYTGNALYGCHPIPDNGKSIVSRKMCCICLFRFIFEIPFIVFVSIVKHIYRF